MHMLWQIRIDYHRLRMWRAMQWECWIMQLGQHSSCSCSSSSKQRRRMNPPCKCFSGWTQSILNLVQAAVLQIFWQQRSNWMAGNKGKCYCLLFVSNFTSSTVYSCGREEGSLRQDYVNSRKLQDNVVLEEYTILRCTISKTKSPPLFWWWWCVGPRPYYLA